MSATAPASTCDPHARGSTFSITLTPEDAGASRLGLSAFWRYRDLLYFLALRDIQVRYKQTALGVCWAVLQPVVTMIVLSIFFGRLAGMESKTGGVPYPLFVFAGLLPWMFFASTVTASSGSVLSNANLVGKVYFPRVLLPMAAMGAPLVDLAAGFAVLAVLMAGMGAPLTPQALLLPVLVLITTLTALGVGVLLAALSASYRDFRHVVPFLLQVWMLLTPVIWPVSLVPGRWRWALNLNPLHGTIEGFRSALLGSPMDWLGLLTSVATAALVLILGLWYFRRTERWFADVV